MNVIFSLMKISKVSFSDLTQSHEFMRWRMFSQVSSGDFTRYNTVLLCKITSDFT